MAKERREVSAKDFWNIEALYPSLEEWKADFLTSRFSEVAPYWPNLSAYRGRLKESAAVLAECLELSCKIDRHLSKLYTYAHLRHDEDLAQPEHKAAFEQIMTLLHVFRQETAWIEPEILAISSELLAKFLQQDILAPFKISIEKMIRLRPHTLSAEQEELVAMAGQALETAHKAFSAFNNADLQFLPAVDSKGESFELTHGTYRQLLRNQDRALRKSAFTNMHSAFAAYENTLCELINGQVQKHLFSMRARHYGSCLEAALFPHEIDQAVYYRLIEAVNQRIGSLHRYVEMRSRVLQLDEMHLYDLQVPLVQDAEMKIDFDEAVHLVVESVAPLGEEYQRDLARGLREKGWVDRYENMRKRSGAYSSGCYDSMPYILMNYCNTFSDLMTLAHECGHSMHTLLSARHQPYQYAHYPIFVAEVASTFNEELLSDYLFQHLQDPVQKAFLINQQIEDIRATFFRQTMFAQFELQLHEWVQQGTPLTPSLLKTAYRELNKTYFGKSVVVDEQIDWEWARIPHFYYNFYVYQYATGISAAHALVDSLRKNGAGACKSYLQFLSSGSSKGPLELLALAGVDMLKTDAIEATINRFDYLVGELASLLGESEKKHNTTTTAIETYNVL